MPHMSKLSLGMEGGSSVVVELGSGSDLQNRPWTRTFSCLKVRVVPLMQDIIRNKPTVAS
ncbi:hypothetical protein LOAG_15206, partial [Loa loa]